MFDFVILGGLAAFVLSFVVAFVHRERPERPAAVGRLRWGGLALAVGAFALVVALDPEPHISAFKAGFHDGYEAAHLEASAADDAAGH